MKITIQPVKVKDLPAFIKAVEPVIRALAEEDLLSVFSKHGESIIEATVIGAGVERQWLEEQSLDVLLELASEVLRVNTDFFVKKVKPKLDELMGTSSGGMN